MHKSKKNMEASFSKVNKFFPLLTDVLPYETPFKFSNIDFYRALKNSYYNQEEKNYSQFRNNTKKHYTVYNEKIETFFFQSYLPKTISELLSTKKYTIPYDYNIKKHDLDFRTISLIHPITQCKVCDFYEKYKDSILYNCGKSDYSMRYPKKVARLIHKNMSSKKAKLISAHTSYNEGVTTDLKIDIAEDNKNVQQEDLISTYFVYNKYNILYKFFDSAELINLEKKYKYYKSLDIARCFKSIYTHSIAWAVKDKQHIKSNLQAKRKTFENAFDELVQKSNFNETAGIPIGAEISRIFAEIIFQDIDVKLKKKLKSLNCASFEIRRYVDDYFVFYNEESTCEVIKATLVEYLKEYNLYLNKAKEEIYIRPFVNQQTLAKKKTREILKDFFNSYYIIDKGILRCANVIKPRSKKHLLDALRSLLIGTTVDFTDIVSYLLSIIKRELMVILEKLLLKAYEKNEDMKQLNIRLSAFLKILAEASFYFYSMSSKASTTYHLYKINFLIIQSARLLSTDSCNELKRIVHREVALLLEDIGNSKDLILIEQLDLITLLSIVEEKVKLSQERLLRIFSNSDIQNHHELSYFHIVSLIDYIHKNSGYENIQREIEALVLSKLKHPEGLRCTENFLLLVDLIKCPYLSEKAKEEMLKAIGLKNNILKAKNDIQQRVWFYSWVEQLELTSLLELKELQLAYS
ncbi:MAG: antiviral reverse transcriptase Drt3b [Akkermansia sp.]